MSVTVSYLPCLPSPQSERQDRIPSHVHSLVYASNSPTVATPAGCSESAALLKCSPEGT